MSETSIRLCRSDYGENLTVTIVLSDHDMARLKLDGIDRQVVSDQFDQPADILLALEVIFRRMTEQGILPSPLNQRGL
jgi:hypothetical protein